MQAPSSKSSDIPLLDLQAEEDDYRDWPGTNTAVNPPRDSTFPNDKQHLFFLAKTTAYWAMGGIGFMLLGTILLQFTLLPHIYTCPPGAHCSRSFDPRGQILAIVQTVMLYWLRIGCLISGIGLFRALAYQAWFTMITRGDTVGNLELTLASIHGNTSKAVLLIWRRHNLFLAFIVLGQLVIFQIVPVVVNRSISNLASMDRSVTATFTYPKRFTFPSVRFGSTPMVNVDLRRSAWTMGDNGSYPIDDFHGTFVFRDNRTLYALGTQPGGTRVTGTVSCSGEGVSSALLPPRSDNAYNRYNISYGNQWMMGISLSNTLSSAFLGQNLRPILSSDNTSVYLNMIWSSSRPGQLVNYTTTNDGLVFITRCIHTIDILPVKDEQRDPIQPSSFSPSSATKDSVCAGLDDDVCLKVVIGYVILAGAVQQGRSSSQGQLVGVRRFCRRGALTGIPDDSDATCVVDTDSWSGLLAIVAEAMIGASDKQGTATQDLRVLAQSISRFRWWFQAIIPASTFVLYAATLASILFLNRRRVMLLELSVPEVMVAAVREQPIGEYALRGNKIDSLWVGGGFLLKTGYWIGNIPRSLLYSPGNHASPSDDASLHTILQKHNSSPPDALDDSSATTARSRRDQKSRWAERRSLAWFLFKTSAYPVLIGFFLMMSGITIFHLALLRRSFTCPGGATCGETLDPRNDGAVLRVLQTVMIYWLQTGCLISSIGLARVIAYHAHHMMNKKGSTIRALELKLATIDGGVFKAIRLLSTGSYVLVFFVVLQFGVGSVVPLLANLSLSKLTITGVARANFTYPENFTLPGVVLPGTPRTGLRQMFRRNIIDEYLLWMLGDNVSYPVDDFSGTFVVRDNRTVTVPGAHPGGTKVVGSVSCNATNISSVADPNSNSYNVSYNEQWAEASPNLFLGSAFMREPYVLVSEGNRSTVALHLLWMSNTPGTISNTTTTSDGKMHLATCIHTIELVPLSAAGRADSDSHVKPSTFFLSPEARNNTHPFCASGTQDELCMALIIGNFFLLTSGASGNDGPLPVGQRTVTPRVCSRDSLGFIGNISLRTCSVNARAWTITLGGLTDSLVKTSQRLGDANQVLWVRAESISEERWWLQAIVPCATLGLYVVCVGYVVFVNPGLEGLRRLSLSEIIATVVGDPEEVVQGQIQRGEPIHEVMVGGGCCSRLEKRRTMDTEREVT